MLQKNKYWKTLLGFFAEGFVGKQVAYTDDTTYTDFVANSVEGEIGIFNADTYAAIDGSLVGSPAAVVPASTTAWLFIAMKRDSQIEQTNKFRIADRKLTRSAAAAAVAQISDVTNGGAAIVVGKEYGVRIIETTPGNQPFPSWYYSYVAKTGDTLTIVSTAIRDLINDKTNVINKGTDSIVTAALVNTNMLRITASVGASFRIALSADALDIAWKADYTRSGTALPSLGSGTGAQAVEFEKDINVDKGVTTNYPKDGSVPSEYGVPTQFAVSTLTYNTYFITGYRSEGSPTPAEIHNFQQNLVILVPSSGTTPEVAIKGILGL